MAEITPEQVHDLLTSTHDYLTSAEAAAQAKDHLGQLFLDVARQAKAGLRDLSAVSGLHHTTIRAMIQRAIGPGTPDGWDQPELPIWADIATTPSAASTPRNASSPGAMPASPTYSSRPSPVVMV